MTTTSGRLDITFAATLGKVREGDTWPCVQLPDSAAIFGTRGLVKVVGIVDDASGPGQARGMSLPVGRYSTRSTRPSRTR